MKKWVRMLTMAIVGTVFLIGVTGAQAIMENGTETTYIAADEKLGFVWDEDSNYELLRYRPTVRVDKIDGGAFYEFVIPNFYDPLELKTVEITIAGQNDGTSRLPDILNVIGSDSSYDETAPAWPVPGEFKRGASGDKGVTELWYIEPNPDYEIVTIWVPDTFVLRGIKIVTQSVPLENETPVAECKDVTISTEPELCSADASIDNGSYDPDGDSITLEQTPLGPYELGDTDVTLTVTDENGASDTCDATVTVIDEEAPVISSVTASPDRLWPPNHKMVPVVLEVDATDNCDLDVCGIKSVTSNEPVNGLGDGDTAPDWVITGDLTVNLRAERSGTGNGRIYSITVECTDESGNYSTDTTEVSVPHDNGNRRTITRSRGRSRRR